MFVYLVGRSFTRIPDILVHDKAVGSPLCDRRRVSRPGETKTVKLFLLIPMVPSFIARHQYVILAT